MENESASAPLREWYSVGFDDRAIALQVSPPNGVAWEETIAWERIIQVCFKTGDWMESDEIYLFTDGRPESYVIPTEAAGGRALWSEILARQLFDAEMAIQAATTTHELFCSPLQDGQRNLKQYGSLPPINCRIWRAKYCIWNGSSSKKPGCLGCSCG